MVELEVVEHTAIVHFISYNNYISDLYIRFLTCLEVGIATLPGAPTPILVSPEATKSRLLCEASSALVEGPSHAGGGQPAETGALVPGDVVRPGHGVLPVADGGPVDCGAVFSELSLDLRVLSGHPC